MFIILPYAQLVKEHTNYLSANNNAYYDVGVSLNNNIQVEP